MDGSQCKETTEDYFALDIREVKRHGLIDAEEMPEELVGVATIEWISAGFGAGEGYALRPWFLCPRDNCGRRVAILYGRTDPDEHPSGLAEPASTSATQSSGNTG